MNKQKETQNTTTSTFWLFGEIINPERMGTGLHIKLKMHTYQQSKNSNKNNYCHLRSFQRLENIISQIKHTAS